jgi:dTDP-4-dehydrorhamnose reductase
MSQKPSIFLTGGSGLLAVNWFYSKRNDYSVYLGLNERIINPKGGHVLKIDFGSTNVLLEKLEAIQPSVIIHTAGLTSVEKCENNPDLAYRINVELSCRVAHVAKQLAIPMVHISTDHLFDGRSSFVEEEEVTHPLNMYGNTKAKAENEILIINPDALIIRTNFYGWGTSYRKSFSDQIIQSLRSYKSIQLFDDVYYTPILAENLIQTVHDLLDKNAKGIFHVVSDDKISKYEFGVLIAEEFVLDKAFIKRSTLKSHFNLVKRPVDMSLSNRKARELLGRSLGTVEQHITQLHKQEINGKIQEIQFL